MGSYLLLYHGGQPPTTPEEGQQVMTAWIDWFTKLGDKIVDQGNPTSITKSIDGGGSVSDAGSGVTGYSIVKADSVDAAVAVGTSCPHRTFGGSIEVVQIDAIM